MARSWGNARATFEGGVAAPRRGCENVFGARSSAIASPDHCILVIYLSNDLKPLSINLWRLKKRRKKKRKKVKMPKTWVVAKDTPVTVLWNYDLFAAEGHWSWPFPEACCLPRSQETGECIYIYVYTFTVTILSFVESRIPGDILRLESFQGDWRGCLRRFGNIRTVQDL